MNIYAYMKTDTGEYPVFEGDLRLLFPDMGDVFVCPSGYVAVHDVGPPEPPEADHMLIELQPEDAGGHFARSFTSKKIERQPARSSQTIPFTFSARPKVLEDKKQIFPTEATGRIQVTVLKADS
jgi:hypothetical protein